jgi:hypothetical protein
MCPKNASYYGNRAATLMMLGKFREALGDAQQSVRLDDSFVRVCNGTFWGRLSCYNHVPLAQDFSVLTLLSFWAT